MKNFWYRLLSALKIIVVMLLIGAATLSIICVWGYFQHSRQRSHNSRDRAAHRSAHRTPYRAAGTGARDFPGNHRRNR